MWINKTTIQSETSDREYTLSELALDGGIPTGTYGCSCRGWTSYGNCKHLKGRGLRSARESAFSRYSLDYEHEHEVVSDEQWSQIFRLVGERELTLGGMEFLDKWAMKGVKGWSAASIIIWLAATPKKGAG